MTKIIGLTGSIGMGKTTTAKMFSAKGVPVWDADEAVRELYSKEGLAVAPIKQLGSHLVENNEVSKSALKKEIENNPAFLKQLEAIVHPLVAQHRQTFLNNAESELVVLDIPLLFENGMENEMDVVVCVTTDPITQKQRVLDRGSMTESQFQIILSKQMPNAEKCARSDYVIETNTLQIAETMVARIIEELKSGQNDA